MPFKDSRDPLVRRADEFFQRCLQQNPKNSEVLCAYAQLLIRTGHNERGEDYFLRALEYSPDNLFGLLAYGNYLLLRG
jgi:tetratricopeptide (TPR) repeat protein